VPAFDQEVETLQFLEQRLATAAQLLGGVVFCSNWSTRIEYDFVGLRSQTFTFPVSVGGLPAGDQFSGSNRNIQLVNVGTNYKFDPGW
jgi:opacity protein-like surface antigen